MGAKGGGGLTVLVTGAGGFVGAAACDALEARGHRVTRVVRRPTGKRGAVRWDVTEPAPDAVTGARFDVVVHCAGRPGTTDRTGDLERLHVGGTRNALASAPAARFIHISTASVYPGDAPSPLRPEDATGDGLRDDYARTKWGAEQAVRVEAERNGRAAVILRPSLVYGPGDRTLVPNLRSAVFAGRLWLPAAGAYRWSVTPVATLVDAIVREVEATRSATGGAVPTRNVVLPEPVMLGDLFLELASADAGKELRLGSLPAGVMRAAGALTEALYRVFRPRTNPMFTRAAIAYTTEDRVLEA